MSTTSPSQTSSMSRSPSQANCLDPLDALIDFSEYEQVSYHSPSVSPSASSKTQFVRPVASTPTANSALLPSSQQSLPGPSHNYELYKQQTGIPTGAIQSTLDLNPSNMFNYNGYLSGIGGTDDFFDFGSSPSMDLEFDSPATEPAFFYPEQTLPSSSEYVNPSVIGGQDNQSMTPSHNGLPAQGSSVGRLWPGMHQQQAALAKAQQQQRQQQQLIQQQRQQGLSAQPKQRSKAHQPTDPIVEEKISQLLNSMRQSSVTSTADEDRSASQVLAHSHRMRKEEEDMDEDERLLASEEGKKLSSKERRQLRNKVSARAFRSRRKGEFAN
jgi:bZIP-type transcription factor MBZ1